MSCFQMAETIAVFAVPVSGMVDRRYAFSTAIDLHHTSFVHHNSKVQIRRTAREASVFHSKELSSLHVG